VSQLIFVYGSLKQGFHNHRVMQAANAVLLSKAQSKDRAFSLFSLGAFPALDLAKDDETPFKIEGELYEVPKEGVPIIDRLESGYNKGKILINAGEHGLVEADVYYLRPHRAPRVFPMNRNSESVEWTMKARE